MGDAVEMMMVGLLCESCSDFIDGEMPGHPRCCDGCEDEEMIEVKCRVCGCTENNACVGGPFGACWWVEEDLCSACDAVGVPDEGS